MPIVVFRIKDFGYPARDNKFIRDNKVRSVYSIEDGSAIHFKDDKPYKNISFIEGAKVFVVEEKNNSIKENAQKMHSIIKK